MKRKWKPWLVIPALAMGLLWGSTVMGCSDDDNPITPQEQQVPSVDQPELKFDETSVSIQGRGGSGEMGYTLENPVEDGEISARSNANWVHDFDTSEDGVIKFVVDPNNVTDERKATIAVTYSATGIKKVTETFTLIQDPGLVEDLSVNFRFVDTEGNIIKERVMLDIYVIRSDFNSLVPYANYEISNGMQSILMNRPTTLIVTAVANSYNPCRMEIPDAEAGMVVDVEMKPRSGLRIMECNVDYGWGYQDPNNSNWANVSESRKNNFVEWVQKYDPDVITFCELNCFGFGTNIDTDFQEFAKRYGHNYASLRKQGGRNSFPTGISSRYELTNIEKVELQTAPQTGYRVHGFLQADCKGVTVIACHLSSQDAQTRVVEAEEIARRVSSKQYALCSGDMNSDSREDEEHLAAGVWPDKRWWNSPPQYEPIDKYFAVGLKDSFYLISDNFQATGMTCDGNGVRYDYPTMDKTGMKLDCMMMTGDLAQKCDFATVIQNDVTSNLSDHFPYMVHVDVDVE